MNCEKVFFVFSRDMLEFFEFSYVVNLKISGEM